MVLIHVLYVDLLMVKKQGRIIIDASTKFRRTACPGKMTHRNTCNVMRVEAWGGGCQGQRETPFQIP